MEQRDGEPHYRAMMEATFEGVAIHDKGVILDVNAAFAEIFGYPREELVGKAFLDLVAEEDRDRVAENVRRGVVERYEAAGVRKDGTRIHGEVRGKDIAVNGQVHRVVAVRDITLFKDAQRLLEERVRERTRELSVKQHELDARNRELERELQLARVVQRSILPASSLAFGVVRVAARYEPSMDVGGDVYQFAGLSDGSLALLVADVTGHGVSAALSTVLVSSAFREHLGSASAAPQILEAMNAVLVGNLPSGTFLAAAVAVIDTDDGGFELANGGLPGALVARASGEVEELACNNPLLGLLEDGYAADQVCRDALAPGDTLWMFSDGLTDVRSPEGEFFGRGALTEHVRKLRDRDVQEQVDGVWQAARAFARPGCSWDDTTVVAVRRDG